MNQISTLALAAALAIASGHASGDIRLQSRTVQPSPAATAEFIRALQSAPGDALHGLATFSRSPSEQERRELERLGVLLLSPFQSHTYRVRVAKRLDLRALKHPALAMKLTALIPEDRVAQPLWREEFERYVFRPRGEKPRSYVLTPEGLLNVTVLMHRGVPEAESRYLLNRHVQSYEKRTSDSWAAIVRPAALRLLAAEDAVQWIEAGPLPFLPENGRTRVAIFVDPVQMFNLATGQVTGVGGHGVQVVLFDKGMDTSHGDVVANVIRKDNPRVAPHATHEAGTISGTGVLSNAPDSWAVNNTGTPYQWRGMAPLAQLIDANYLEGIDPARHWDYIVNLKTDLSNHSYAMSADGEYSDDNRAHDRLIRGDEVNGSAPIPGRLHVTSAGNNGKAPNEIGNQLGYFSLTKQMKNALVVGGWDVGTGKIAELSSLGPAHDGRIKPDVVAPAVDMKSAGFCNLETPLPECIGGGAAGRRNFYAFRSGTSMAAAATSGALALVLEQYATSFGVDIDVKPPLPSTLRGVMIHTARDQQAASPWLSNEDGAVQPGEGPDFVTGWGLIDAQAAVNVVANRQLLEDKTPETCHVTRYVFRVPPGATGPVRVTLGWDDPASDSASPISDPKLLNDLDLELIDPAGTRHRPWQLNQQILDLAGGPLANELQTCGTPIQVQRQFMPVANPLYVGPGNSGNVNDTIPPPPAGMPFAVRGNDHLNNVEVVDAPAMEGIWQAKVTGFKIAQAPQSYSLIGNTFEKFVFHPISVCALYPSLCAILRMRPNICKKFPKACAHEISFTKPGRIRLIFADPKLKMVLPIDLMCRFAVDCPAANVGGGRRELKLQAAGASLRAAVYTAAGQLVKRDAAAGSARVVRYNALPGEQYFLVLTPGPGVQQGNAYDVALTAK